MNKKNSRTTGTKRSNRLRNNPDYQLLMEKTKQRLITKEKKSTEISPEKKLIVKPTEKSPEKKPIKISPERKPIEKQTEISPEKKAPRLKEITQNHYGEVEVNKAIMFFLKTDIKSPSNLKKKLKGDFEPKESLKKITEFYFIINITFIFKIFLTQITISSLTNNPYLAIILLISFEIIYLIVNLRTFIKYKNCLFFITVLARILESLIIVSLLVLFWILQLKSYRNDAEIQDICVFLIFSGVALEYGFILIIGGYFGVKWVVEKCCSRKRNKVTVVGK